MTPPHDNKISKEAAVCATALVMMLRDGDITIQQYSSLTGIPIDHIKQFTLLVDRARHHLMMKIESRNN